MADTESKWRQHMDKMAYGVALLLGLVVVLIPALSARSKSEDLAIEEQSLKDRITNQKTPDVRPNPCRAILESQWTAGPASSLDPRWVTEVPPVLVRTVKGTPEGEAIHGPGSITEISCQRDKGKKAVYLKVKYAAGAGNMLVVIKKWELLRKVDEGPFQPAPDFKASDEHEYKDYQVGPGKTYSYKLVTTAQLDPKAPERTRFDEKNARQESAPLGPTEPVPYDFSITVMDIPAPKQNEPVPFLGKLMYWSYKDMKIVNVNGGQVGYFPERGTFAEKRYQFLQIIDNPKKVVIRDEEKNVKYTFAMDAKVHRPVKLWAPLVPREAEPPPEEEAPVRGGKASAAKKATDGADQPEEPKAPQKPAAAKKSSGSGESKDKKKRAFK